MFDSGDAGNPETTLTKRERAKRHASRHIKVLVSLNNLKKALSQKDALLVKKIINYTSGIETPLFDKNTTRTVIYCTHFSNYQIVIPTTYSQFTKPSLQEGWNKCKIFYISLLSLSLNNPPKTCFHSPGLSETRLDVLLKIQCYL